MSHTYHKIWLHYVWSTKDRAPMLASKMRSKLIEHVRKYSDQNEIEIDTINSTADHVHLLISMNPSQSPSKIINLIKGESSNWINKMNLTIGKFSWQEGYSVFSVSYFNVEQVRKYIKNQQEHHRKISFAEEIEKMLIAYKINIETP